jgi:hypothetical protein
MRVGGVWACRAGPEKLARARINADVSIVLPSLFKVASTIPIRPSGFGVAHAARKV